MEPNIIKETVVITEHEWLEYASWAAQILVAAIALIAAIVAYRQLKEMADYRKQRIQIANANMLMQLVHRFESHDMTESRQLFSKIKDEVNHTICARHPVAVDEEKLQRITDEWTQYLNTLRKDEGEKYFTLLRIVDFFEEVGTMIKKKYISPDDAMELFKGPILAVGRNFSRHISSRQKEIGVPDGLFANPQFNFGVDLTKVPVVFSSEGR